MPGDVGMCIGFVRMRFHVYVSEWLLGDLNIRSSTEPVWRADGRQGGGLDDIVRGGLRELTEVPPEGPVHRVWRAGRVVSVEDASLVLERTEEVDKPCPYSSSNWSGASVQAE